MPPFRFRAAAALDLRLSEEERARTHLARVRLDLHAAETRAVAARDAAAAAATELACARAEGTEAWRLGWHQSWIVRQRREADALQRAAAVSATAVAHATASVHAAQQRRRALERLRDRALDHYRQDVARHEIREMNALANARFLRNEDARKGQDHDD